MAASDNTPGIGNTILADTVGVLWRATSSITGATAVDPWTQAEINDEAAQAQVKASSGNISYDDAYAQAAGTTASISDNAPSWGQAAGLWTAAVFNDDGSGCSILTNPGGCFPAWAPYAAIGVGVLVVLYILGPYVGLLERR